MSSVLPFIRQRTQALSKGVVIVRKVLKENDFPNGFTSKQLYELAMKEPIPKNFDPFPLQLRPESQPPNPEHPVRSIRFLKKHILPALEGNEEIKMSVQPRTTPIPDPPVKGGNPKKKRNKPQEFLWRIVLPQDRQKAPIPVWQKPVVGREVGVQADVSHLNKRRQAARVGKVSAAVLRLKDMKRREEESFGSPDP